MFIYLQNVIWIYMHIQNSASTTIHRTALNWSCQRGWGGRVTLAFLKVLSIIAIISTILSLIESYLPLSYVLP